jgi:hypothetical protein
MAHLVLASSAIYFDDADGFNDGLARAQAGGPNEGWQAARRHGLGAVHFDTLDAGARDAWTADTALLLGENWGRSIVANTFVTYEPLRPRIEELVARLPNDAQGHFIRLVRGNARDRAATF